MEYSHDNNRFFTIACALGVMSLLIIAFVMMAWWRDSRQMTVTSTYNSEIRALPGEYRTLSGVIEEVDSVRRVFLVRDEQTTVYVTIETDTNTIITHNADTPPFSALTKGKYVIVSARSTPGTGSFIASRIDISDQAVPTIPPGAGF